MFTVKLETLSTRGKGELTNVIDIVDVITRNVDIDSASDDEDETYAPVLENSYHGIHQ